MAKTRRGAAVPPALLVGAIAMGVLGILLGVLLAHLDTRAASPLVESSRSAPPTVRPAPTPQPTPTRRAAPRAPSPAPARVPATPTREPVARVAIIFDDAGGSLEDLQEIIDIGRPVTVAVLPGLRYSSDVASRARSAGLEVFLHLPLEADDGAALGPDGITVDMSDAQIEGTVRTALATVPGAVGVNNHMGSRGSADARVMRAVLRVVKERRLVFVDSMTSFRSVAGRIASEMAIPTASRQMFVDNVDDAAAIRAQLRRLIDLARRRGAVLAIGHAPRLTAQVLRQMLSEFDEAGIALVPASTLVK